MRSMWSVLAQRYFSESANGTWRASLPRFGPYVAEREQSTWFKILNPKYSQREGREELFERDRHSELAPGWHRMGRIDGVQCLARGKSASYVRRELRLSGNLSDWFTFWLHNQSDGAN